MIWPVEEVEDELKHWFAYLQETRTCVTNAPTGFTQKRGHKIS